MKPTPWLICALTISVCAQAQQQQPEPQTTTVLRGGNCTPLAEVERRATEGNLAAQRSLAAHLLEHSKNPDSAILWLGRAAERGDSSAQLTLGKLLLSGKDNGTNPFQAGKWLLRAAEQGNMESRQLLAKLYSEGIGVPVDGFEASRWQRATKYDAKAAIASAISPIPARASRATLQQYLPFAEQGSPLAQYTLGRMYFDAPYGQRDEDKAVFWLTSAARQGHVQAALDLAEILAWGVGGTADQGAALAWYKAASEIDAHRSARAMLSLAYKFSSSRADGHESSSFFWTRQAAMLGLVAAQDRLGLMYLSGDGEPRDVSQAEYWFLKAAENDSAKSQYQLASLYASDKHLDLRKSYFWLSLSAHSGYIGGELNNPEYWNGKSIPDRQEVANEVAQWKAAKAATRVTAVQADVQVCAAAPAGGMPGH